MPPQPAEFKDASEKGAYINQVMQVCQSLVVVADQHFNNMIWPRAYSNYIETLNGYMTLAKITTDDPNFQNYVKSQMNYLIAKAEASKQKAQSLMKDQKVAGYVTR